jgi:hypothetical protein
VIARLRRRHRRLTLTLFLLLALVAWYRLAQPPVDSRVNSLPEPPSATVSR